MFYFELKSTLLMILLHVVRKYEEEQIKHSVTTSVPIYYASS